MSNRTRVLGSWSVGLSLVLATPLIAVGCDDGAGAERPTRKAKVGVVEAIEAGVPDQASFVGEVRSKNVVDLKAMVTGNVTKRLFEAGDDVTKGQLLYEIDIRPFRAAAAEAKARAARAKVTKENARREAERAEKLIKNGAISDVQYERMTAARDEAEAEYKAALASMQVSRLDLDFAKVKSPINGTVDVPKADVGTLVKPTDTDAMVRITELDPIYVYAYISERQFLEFRARRAAAEKRGEEPEKFEFRARLADGTYYPQKGTLDYLSPDMDRRTGSFEFRVKFDNEQKLLKPGQYADVVIGSSDPKPRVLVPRKAIVRKQAGVYAYVVNDEGKVEERLVTLGRITRDLQVVIEGIEAGEKVIASGVQMARPGAEVEVRELTPLEYVPEGAEISTEELGDAVEGGQLPEGDTDGETDGSAQGEAKAKGN